MSDPRGRPEALVFAEAWNRPVASTRTDELGRLEIVTPVRTLM
jgi:hypothetical protein